MSADLLPGEMPNGSSVPDTGASLLTVNAETSLPFSRQLAAGTNVTLVDGGAGSTLTINATAGGGGTWGSITGTLSNQTDLNTALNGKAPTVHTHAISDTTGLQTALDGKSATGHGHAIADTTGLQTALDGKQATDADLTALAALATTGIASRTAANTWAVRTLTGTTNQVTVSNGDGVAGNPTFSLPQNIHTGATPTFASMTLSGLTATRVALVGTGGLLQDNANLVYGSAQLWIKDTTASTSSTTGALRVDGGVGVGGKGYFADQVTVNASGGSSKPLDIGSTGGSEANIRFFTAAGASRFVRFYTGVNMRWGFGANGDPESGSDAGTAFQLWAATDGGTTIDYPLNIIRASGGSITFGSTSRPVSIAKTANAAEWIHGSASELLTLSTAGLTTNTSANLLPANAIIEAVVCRITTAITITTNWAVGDATISNRFSSANATLAAGTTSVGLNHVDLTGTSGPKQTSAAPVRITCTGSNPGAGVVRITVFYRQFIAPTS